MYNRRLFLTSDGLSDNMKINFFNIIKKKPEETKILYIPTAGIVTDSAREGLAICLAELSLMGLRNENIVVYNLELIISKDYKRTYSSHIKEPAMITRLLTIEELELFDAVFVGGGDAAVLCREMVRTGFDRILVQAIDQGLVYVGISAGSMYAAGNLSDGLHIINNTIVPHSHGTKLGKILYDSEEIQLSDGQAVYVEGDCVSLI